MTEQDPHSPTNAGPEPETEPIPVPEPEVVVPPAETAEAEPAPEPTPVIGASDATWNQPAGSALLDGGPAGAPEVEPHPEKKVGAAFAGGLAAAVFLKILANRKHR